MDKNKVREFLGSGRDLTDEETFNEFWSYIASIPTDEEDVKRLLNVFESYGIRCTYEQCVEWMNTKPTYEEYLEALNGM